jgi:ABC-type branched-subunit amino acid transport system substrate-binding protein
MRKFKQLAFVSLIAATGIYLVSAGNAKPLAPALDIGVLVSDSGDLRFAGPIQRVAARLAANDLAEAYPNLKIDLDLVDVGVTEKDNQGAINKLKSLGVDVIIAPIESDSARVLVSNLAKKQIPVIAPSSLEDDLGEAEGKPWLFRLATSPSQDTFALGNLIATSKAKSALIVSSSQEESRAQMKSLAFGLVMKGVRVQTLGIKDSKAIAKTKPEAAILLSMEESIEFFRSMQDWVSDVPQMFLVPGNLADYSLYPWAKSLRGALAIYPKTKVPASFRSDLAEILGTQSLTGARSQAVMALAQKTYDAVTLAGKAFIRAASPSSEAFRDALANFQMAGSKLFTKQGFYDQNEYSVFKYGNSGMFTLSSTFSPN